MSYLDRQEVIVVCPGCKRANTTTVGWIRANDVVHCAGCDKNIKLQQKNLLPKLKAVEEGLDAFLREVRSLGETVDADLDLPCRDDGADRAGAGR
jgi:transposase-like protein